MDLAQEKGASSWLTTLPLKEFNFALHKGAFRDAVALRYGWQPKTPLLTAPVAPASPLNTLSPVQKVVSK